MRLLHLAILVSFGMKLRRSRSHPAQSIDGVSGDNGITELWASKLQGLFSSQNTAACNEFYAEVSQCISPSILADVTVSSATVVECLGHLKHNKSDGSALSSDFFIHSAPVLADSLASFFSSVLRHGYMPTCIRDCILDPIPKGQKDASKSDNYYRSIALAPSISKILEWVILYQYSDAFVTSDLQFGFKRGMSTSLCTGFIKCVVSRYMQNDSAVYGCFLDASKAFDLVNHEILFKRLMDRKLPTPVLRLLMA